MSVAYRCLRGGGGCIMVGRRRLCERCMQKGYILEEWVNYGRVAYLRGGVYSQRAG